MSLQKCANLSADRFVHARHATLYPPSLPVRVFVLLSMLIVIGEINLKIEGVFSC